MSFGMMRVLRPPGECQNSKQTEPTAAVEKRQFLLVDLTDDGTHLYACDVIGHCVWRLDDYEKGTAAIWQNFVGRNGSGPGEFCCPISCVVSGNAIMYVSDWGNRRIQSFELNSAQIKSVFHFHAAERPGALAILRSSGQLLALSHADLRVSIRRGRRPSKGQGCGAIVRFTVDEAGVLKEDRRREINTKRGKRPWGMCACEDANNETYVAIADYGCHKIRLFVNPF